MSFLLVLICFVFSASEEKKLERHIGKMQHKIHDLLPVNGNQYHTPYGLYACKITASALQGNIIRLAVSLLRERDGLEPVRLCTIIGAQQAIERNRLGLVMDIHKWALLDRSADEYLLKEVLIYEDKVKP